MKKCFVFIAFLALIFTVSCSVNPEAEDKLVPVSFSAGSDSRVLVEDMYATHNPDSLYWTFTAVKLEGIHTTGASKLDASGDPIAENVWVGVEDRTGLSGAVRKFSTGKWKFTVKGYTDKAHSAAKLVYKGEKEIELKTDTVSRNILFPLTCEVTTNSPVEFGKMSFYVPAGMQFLAGSQVKVVVSEENTKIAESTTDVAVAMQEGLRLDLNDFVMSVTTLSEGEHTLTFDVWYDRDTAGICPKRKIATGSYKYRFVKGNTTCISGVLSNLTDLSTYLCFTAEQAGSTIKMAKAGTAPAISVQYSDDETQNWKTFTVGTTTVTLANVGDTVYFRGSNGSFSVDASNYNRFVMTGKIAASGSAMSLLDNCGKSRLLTTPLSCLFSGCTVLSVAPDLPATVLCPRAYYDMFSSCSGLKILPEALPAKDVSDYAYRNMFLSCTGLEVVHDGFVVGGGVIGAEGCRSMFNGCTSLVSVPSDMFPSTKFTGTSNYMYMFQNCKITTGVNLPARCIPNNCYQNFYIGCTKLVSAPNMTLSSVGSNGCYSMFSGCTSLEQTPQITFDSGIHTGLGEIYLGASAFAYMFNGCTGLKCAYFSLNRATTNFAQYMFKGCSNLKDITLIFNFNPSLGMSDPDYWATTWFTGWVTGVASSGTFRYKIPSGGAAIDVTTRNANRIPAGWTVTTDTSGYPHL